MKTIKTLRQYLTWNILNVRGFPLHHHYIYSTLFIRRSKRTPEPPDVYDKINQTETQQTKDNSDGAILTTTQKRLANDQGKRVQWNQSQREWELIQKGTNLTNFSRMQKHVNGNQSNQGYLTTT
ncbi:hypothetical protein OXYTRIMIC_417 [Oxytricha trifallax]|uniref:Uncharacterized protein n=1 Tax=Oxytricha trifallax TaxID=1172189 RepID=A0A073HYB3_9SPIT|nr:hypothetical protein OXYTRIMIC_417 [Oxytricha trifallax]